MTKWLHQYLSDYGDSLAKGHLDRWLAGTVDPGYEADARSRAVAVAEIVTLEFGSVAQFYADQQPEQTQGQGEDEVEID